MLLPRQLPGMDTRTAPCLCRGMESNKFGSGFYRDGGAKSTQAKRKPVSSQPWGERLQMRGLEFGIFFFF